MAKAFSAQPMVVMRSISGLPLEMVTDPLELKTSSTLPVKAMVVPGAGFAAAVAAVAAAAFDFDIDSLSFLSQPGPERVGRHVRLDGIGQIAAPREQIRSVHVLLEPSLKVIRVPYTLRFGIVVASRHHRLSIQEQEVVVPREADQIDSQNGQHGIGGRQDHEVQHLYPLRVRRGSVGV